MNKKSLNNFPWLLKSAECFYHTWNTRIQYIGDKCRVSVRFSVVGVHCHSLVLLPLAITEHITMICSLKRTSTNYPNESLGIMPLSLLPTRNRRSIARFIPWTETNRNSSTRSSTRTWSQDVSVPQSLPLPPLLRQEKGRHVTTHSRLPEAQQDDD